MKEVPSSTQLAKLKKSFKVIMTTFYTNQIKYIPRLTWYRLFKVERKMSNGDFTNAFTGYRFN